MKANNDEAFTALELDYILDELICPHICHHEKHSPMALFPNWSLQQSVFPLLSLEVQPTVKVIFRDLESLQVFTVPKLLLCATYIKPNKHLSAD